MENWELVQKVVVVLVCVYLSWKIIRYIWSFVDVEKDPLVVLVTGAAGQIGYALVPMIARGAMLGPDQPIILHMHDIEPAADILKGVKMELEDGAFPLLKGVITTTDVVEACKGVDIAILLGGFPRRKGMKNKDLISKNIGIYKAQASALEQHADTNCKCGSFNSNVDWAPFVTVLLCHPPRLASHCVPDWVASNPFAEKVLVVANPANTNALILKEYAPSIPEENITSLTRLDHNRALHQLSENLNVHVGDVKNVIMWGNHSSNQYPDGNHAIVNIGVGYKPVKELVVDDDWLNTEFIRNVQQRGEAIIKAKRLSTALSAASATCDHMRDWILGTPKGTWVSMGVYSDGSYGIQPGLIYSFPVTCEKGEWSIVQGLKIDEFAREKMDALEKELLEEKAWAYSCLH